jgi:thiosulfate dehydrogenase [quinone] large subunit
VESAPWLDVSRSNATPEPSLRERLERASVPARALLPIRFFFGATFVYAGMDKLLDPSFFDASSPASIYSQLTEFARVSPLAPLVRLSEPFALPIGLLIALAEIAIGLGAISGLAFRLSAAGGALLSFLFWLTASWTTHPFYYGPDLPYAFGWTALALAGDGELLVPAAVREIGRRIEDDWPLSLRTTGRRLRDPWYKDEDDVSPVRRQVLQTGVLGGLALALASLAVPLRILRPRSLDDAQSAGLGSDLGTGTGTGSGAGASAAPASPGSAGGSAAPSGGPSAAPATGLTIAKISDVDAQGARRFRVPSTAPSPLPAGDPGIIVKLGSGQYVAYDATCTHEGCRVGWDAQDGILLCPCHGAAFDPSNHGEVLGGPTNQPLYELPIVIDQQAGTISLKA